MSASGQDVLADRSPNGNRRWLSHYSTFGDFLYPSSSHVIVQKIPSYPHRGGAHRCESGRANILARLCAHGGRGAGGNGGTWFHLFMQHRKLLLGAGPCQGRGLEPPSLHTPPPVRRGLWRGNRGPVLQEPQLCREDPHIRPSGGGGGGRVLRVLAPPGLERHLGKEETVSKLNLLRAGPETLQEGRAVA